MEDAIPSSPPLAPTRPLLTRKRTRASELSTSCPSSDPAFFSSDDIQDEGAENYNSDRPRKKVQWNGTWWDKDETRPDRVSGRTRAATKRRDGFQRNMDSGIWMASDDSEATVPDSDILLPPDSNVTVVLPTPRRKSPRSEMDIFIERKITDAMDAMDRRSRDAHVNVSLDGLQLDVLNGELLLPLQTIVASAPHLDAAGSSSPRAYAPLTPDLAIYLSNNKLTRLPRQLFDLEHLVAFSLRNNDLAELPDGIGRLRRLELLNISNNNLRYLPSSLLPLWSGQDRNMSSLDRWSNPFVNPIAMLEPSWKHGQMDLQFFMPLPTPNVISAENDNYQPMPDGLNPRLVKWIQRIRNILRERWSTFSGQDHDILHERVWEDPLVVTSTPTTYHDTNGVPIIGRPISEQSDEQIIASLDGDGESTRSADSTRVPSLFEQCLMMCTLSPDLPKLATLMPPDTSPAVLSALKTAQTSYEEGGQSCSKCSRRFVLTRAERLDFVFYARRCSSASAGQPERMDYDEMMVPYIQRFCSWSCAQSPRLVEKKRCKCPEHTDTVMVWEE